VVGVISPWNYPVNLSLMPVLTAIAAGNRVMLKPSKFTPATNAVIASMISEIFPEDQVQLDSDEVWDEAARDWVGRHPPRSTGLTVAL
jgi:coniferyl-aldehyde dehydrogenase